MVEQGKLYLDLLLRIWLTAQEHASLTRRVDLATFKGHLRLLAAIDAAFRGLRGQEHWRSDGPNAKLHVDNLSRRQVRVDARKRVARTIRAICQLNGECAKARGVGLLNMSRHDSSGVCVSTNGKLDQWKNLPMDQWKNLPKVEHDMMMTSR
jgi:hypothetical protein